MSKESIEKIAPKKKRRGKKFDGGKLRWMLLPFECIEEVIRVLMFGADIYGSFNWQYTIEEEGGEERYLEAAFRHLSARADKKIVDKDSGFCAAAHLICCGIFLLWKDLIGIVRGAKKK